MTATPATSAYEIVLAVHVMAVVVAFGVTFAYPIMFAVTARSDPRGLPLMHRVEYTIERTLINPVLGLVLIAGIFLASDGHHWGQFFVAWGVAAVVVIGAVVGSVLIPTAKRAETTAERDIAASTGDPVEMSEEYRMLTRRLQVVGTLLSVLVLVTILFMVIKP
jgi:phosphotransferase system  glucose/maltose/N-acetylglucosamine-specific IIC component